MTWRTGPADGDFAFVPLAMPLMFGPGEIATIIGLSALVKEERSLLSFLAIFAAILATTVITYLMLVSAKRVLRRIGSRGLDAATRIVGFFVSAMGMGLIFHGLTDVLQRYGVVPRQSSLLNKRDRASGARYSQRNHSPARPRTCGPEKRAQEHARDRL